MIKKMFVALFFVAGLPLVAEEMSSESDSVLQECQDQSLLYFSQGYVALLTQQPREALEQFQQASDLCDTSDSSCLPLQFLVRFGQVVAYDCLGCRDECAQALNALSINFDASNEEDGSLLEEVEPYPTTDADSADVLAFLHSIAICAPSFEVRQILFSLIQDIAKEMEPAFQFTKAQPLDGDVLLSRVQDEYSIKLCRHKMSKRSKSGGRNAKRTSQ